MGSNTAFHHTHSSTRQFAGDMLVLLISFYIATAIRFNEWYPAKTMNYLPATVLGAFAFSCSCYILGLYAPLRCLRWQPIHRGARLMGALLAGVAVMLAVGSLHFSSRIGRGVLMIGLPTSAVLAFLRHWLQGRLHRDRTEESVACMVTEESDEAGAMLFRRIEHRESCKLGLILHGHTPTSDTPVLGTLADLGKLIHDEHISTVLCSEKHLADPTIGPILRQARYAGIEITTLASACEEVYQAMPLELVSDNWLVAASAQPRIFYIRRAKRIFDITMAVVFLLLLGVPLLLGMLLVKLGSPGRVFYSQIRVGRFGRNFTIYKLRTMHENAEADGAKWATKNDPRLFFIGKWLRKFRIDEIPQLWNILLGDMSFVGPRPERPEFVAQLSKAIPWFAERTMVQPGLTGWAQARYPYGASVEDARRKLEYDLYYVKHMGLLLDSLILLDTARIVLMGGVHRESWEGMAKFTEEIRTTSFGMAVPPNPAA